MSVALTEQFKQIFWAREVDDFGLPKEDEASDLLDDDDAVRAVAADDLRQAGFAVVEASSGIAALDLIDEHRDIAAAIVDFAMPGMNGAEFARRARERRALPVLFVTGYADRDSIDALDDVAVVLKPYRSGAVASALRRLIDKVHMPQAR